MQIVEVKNNLVRVNYSTSQENLVLSGFVVIKDPSQSFIGQIIHLEANSDGSYVVVKLLFTFDSNGVITSYNGSIPDPQSPLDVVYPQELLELLPVQNPIIIGELAQQKIILNLDRSFLEGGLLACSEKEEDNTLLIKNLATQLVNGGKKVLIIDLNGDLNFSQNKVIAAENFKLPLNYDSINFIYEKGLNDAKAETKALIQEIFLEVQNYVKTLSEKFIPFETFMNVVDAQYQETELVELVLLKNKLLKYYEEGIFAQDKKEFKSFEISLEKNDTTILDLSKIDEKIQREIIAYAYSLINQLDKEIYVICNLDNTNSDKKLLKQIYLTQKAYSTLVCPYGYKYLKELKQLSKNLILFAPIQQQNDFAGYNTFLSKLNVNEFVIYGQATHHLPLIVRLDEIPNLTSIGKPIGQGQEQVQVEEQPSEEDLLDEQIKRDVDEIYTAPKKEKYPEDNDFSVEVLEDGLTEEDLDLIDSLNITETEETDNVLPDEELADKMVVDEVGDIALEEEVPEENIEIIEEEQQQSNIFSEVLNKQTEEQYSEPPAVDILPVKMSSTPIVPIYSADVEPKAQSDELEQGDVVMHPKYGKGTVEKLITYGSKTLCSINFDNVGRRLLDPTLVEIKKV